MTPIEFVHFVLKPVLIEKTQADIQSEDNNFFELTNGFGAGYLDEKREIFYTCYDSTPTQGMIKIYNVGDKIDIYNAIEHFSSVYRIPEEDFVDRLKNLGEIAETDLNDYNHAKKFLGIFK